MKLTGKKLLLLSIILFTSSLSIADVTSPNDRFTLLCEAVGVPGFKWTDNGWEATIFSGPKLTIVKKQEYEKHRDDIDFNEDEVVHFACTSIKTELNINSLGFSKQGCYSFQYPGEELSITNVTTCGETWSKDDSGLIKLQQVNCKKTPYTSIKYDFEINGEFTAYKPEPYLGFNVDGMRDGIWMKAGSCSQI